MNYQESVEYIHSLLKFGIKPGLSRIKNLLNELSNPQKDLRFVHIAGTNGKGTTATHIANILTCSGKKTGLFTSPYVAHFLERIQIDGKMVSEETFAYACSKVRNAVEKMDEQPTEFEVITAAALLCYKEENCDEAVLEVGLGGRFDATNIIENPLLSVIVSISLDHTRVLGDTIEKIAFEKCGIIKQNGITVTNSNQKEEAMAVIKNTAEKQNNILVIADLNKAKILSENLFETVFTFENEKYSIALSGFHQVENAVTAIKAAEKLDGVSREDIKNGLKITEMKARMQVFEKSPLVLLDGGHNLGCAKALKSVLKKNVHTKIHAVIGMMADKDCDKYLSTVLPLCESVVTVTPDNPRAISAKDIAAMAEKYCKNVFVAVSPEKALIDAKKRAGNDAVVICGSFYLAGEYLK